MWPHWEEIQQTLPLTVNLPQVNSVTHNSDWPGKTRPLCNNGMNTLGQPSILCLYLSLTVCYETHSWHHCWAENLWLVRLNFRGPRTCTSK